MYGYTFSMNIEEILKAKLLQNKRGDYRSDMIKEIMDFINKERIGTVFKKTNYVTILKKVEHLDDSSLAYTLSICKDCKNRGGSFGKCFFGCLKPKNVQ